MDFDGLVTDFLTGREDPRAHSALERLVDFLHSDRSAAITSFLSHPGSEDLLAALVGMLLSVSVRVSGNAAYALGILSETEAGFQRVYYLANKDKNNKDRLADSSTSVLENLVDLLVSKDTESIMNVAGTLGALAETQAGRTWMLESPCIDTLIDRITLILQSDNTWTAGNSALVLARLSISEEGCIRLLQHKNYKTILGNLINSLGSAGRGTNAAFAIGRLCDQKMGQKALENHDGLEKMVSQLYKMLNSDDIRWSKNACFALSCLASKKWGQDKLLSSYHCSEILGTLARLLFSEDHETGWFSAVALHTLASLPKGCLQIRKNISVETAMKKVIEVNPNAELKAEVTSALEFLKRLQKPEPPKVQSISASEIKVKWDPITSKCGFPITYKVFKDDQCVSEGKDCVEFTIDSLQSVTKYRIRLQACAEEDNSPLSDVVTAVTIKEGRRRQRLKRCDKDEESGLKESMYKGPSPPLNLQIVGRTVNLLKISWDPPQYSNGTIKFYHVLTEIQDGTGSPRLFETTTPETSSIISGLTPGTTYKVQILAATPKGKSLPASILARTSEPGSHVPPKPNVTVIGRSELHVTWSAPAEPLGRINHYELSMNDIVVYSGNNMNFYIRRLTPDTEYIFMISAVTSEGRFDSKTVKKRTAKDEYEANSKVLTTAETSTAVEEPKSRPQTSLPRRCKSACVLLKSCKSSSKAKNITNEARRTGKSPTADSHSIKRPIVHSAVQRYDCSQRKMSVKSWNPSCTTSHEEKSNDSTSHEEKSNGKSVPMFPSYINISLRSGNWKDKVVNADTTQTVRNGRVVRTKTFVFSQSNRSAGRQMDTSTNDVEAEVSCDTASTSVQDDYAFGKTIDMTNNTMKSINSSGSPMVHSACRMWSVPSAFRSKSAVRSQPNKSGSAITSRFSNFLFRSCRESQGRSVFNSHRWLAMESRPCLELRVPVSTPETAHTNSTSSRKSSSYSDASSTDKKQVCFEEVSKHDDLQTSSKEPLPQEEPNQETLLQSLQTLEIHEGAANDQTGKTKSEPYSLSNIQISTKDTEPQIISCSENSTDWKEGNKSREIIQGSSEICDYSSKTGGRENANCDNSHECKGSVDSDKNLSAKTWKLEKEPGHDRNGHFLNRTSNILPFNENNLSREKCWKTMESYSKRAKPRTVRSARSLKFNRSAPATRRPGTVSVSGSGRHRSAGVNSLSGKANTNEDNLRSEGSARFLGIRTMTLTPTPNLIGSRNNNSMFSEGFVPSQLRTQPCNLNLRQLQRIHTTLLGIRGGNDKLLIQTLLYQRNQDQQRNTTTQTNELGKSSKRLTQKSATVRGSSHSYRNELITGTSKIPLHHRNMEPDSILLRQSWT